jgi:hypothetical protein
MGLLYHNFFGPELPGLRLIGFPQTQLERQSLDSIVGVDFAVVAHEWNTRRRIGASRHPEQIEEKYRMLKLSNPTIV